MPRQWTLSYEGKSVQFLETGRILISEKKVVTDEGEEIPNHMSNVDFGR